MEILELKGFKSFKSFKDIRSFKGGSVDTNLTFKTIKTAPQVRLKLFQLSNRFAIIIQLYRLNQERW